MSPGERAALGRREPARPQYAATAPGFPPPYYPPYGMPHPNAWLGAPLISMAGRNTPARQTPVSKLAMHAQGAPLIIQNRSDRRKYTAAPEQRSQKPHFYSEHIGNRDGCEVPEGNRPRNQQMRSNRTGRNNNTDAVSVTSDESSGSTNSETMLPRIIKPRKRRKKDRKPNNVATHDLTSVSLDIGDIDHCSVSRMSSGSGIYDRDTYCREMSLPYSLDVNVLEYSESVPETYRVAVLEEALEATRFDIAEAVSPSESAVTSCQCRYCDPVGQIWDADSIADLLDENSSGDFTPTKLEDSMKVVGSIGRRGADATLRRSWSDPSSRVPEKREINNSDTFSSPNLYSLFPPARSISLPEPRSPLALEISSEIVTSMNGHRDLEIKLFSTSPSATNTEHRSFFADKSESVVNRCTIPTNEQKVSNVINSDKSKDSANGEKKNVDATDPECSSGFRASRPSPNVCDLALITV